MKKESNKSKNYWNNLTLIQRFIIIFIGFIFGASILQFLLESIAQRNKTPEIQRVPVYVPVPSQSNIYNQMLREQMEEIRKILNPSGVRCFEDLDPYGRSSINCQKY